MCTLGFFLGLLFLIMHYLSYQLQVTFCSCFPSSLLILHTAHHSYMSEDQHCDIGTDIALNE